MNRTELHSRAKDYWEGYVDGYKEAVDQVFTKLTKATKEEIHNDKQR